MKKKFLLACLFAGCSGIWSGQAPSSTEKPALAPHTPERSSALSLVNAERPKDVMVAPAPGLIPVYRETLAADLHSRYYFSSRPKEEAERFGWVQTSIAFFAFLGQAPGTVLIYCETPTAAPHSTYYYSTRTEEEAARLGWTRLGPAFFAYPGPAAGLVPVYAETLSAAPHTQYNLSTRSKEEAQQSGWTQIGAAFWIPKSAITEER